MEGNGEWERRVEARLGLEEARSLNLRLDFVRVLALSSRLFSFRCDLT